jgi:hypothetical protein
MSTRKHPVAICGFANTGKDTAAEYIATKYGYKVEAFATRVRKVLEAVNPIVGQRFNEDRDHLAYRYVYYNDAVRELGYAEAKKRYPIRPLLIALGNACKEQLGPTVWIDPVLPRDYYGAPPAVQTTAPTLQPTLVTDVRYPDEYQRLEHLNGFLIAIHRSGVGPANEHETLHVPTIQSRTVMHVHNDGTLEELYRKLDGVMGTIETTYTLFSSRDGILRP